MPEKTQPSERVNSLDGLRGVAALVVVLNHVLITSVVFAEVADKRGRADHLSFEWWLSYTPLHLIWGGTEAVFVFFILSGYVLTGPTMKSRFSWLVYYPKRLIRLYVPVWGSLLLAAGSALLITRGPIEGASWWVNAHGPLDVGRAFLNGLLLGPIDFLNNPLWSLAWEMWFSLFLPVYILICRWGAQTTARTIAVLVLIGGTMAAGSVVDSNALRYMPMFAIGIMIYLYRDKLRVVATAVGKYRWAYVLIFAAAVLLTTSYWMAQAHPSIPRIVVSSARSAQVIGTVLFVLLALYWPAAQRLLERRSIRWLGQRSFSLYLTHDAVVISTTLLLGGHPPFWLTLVIAVPIALLLAEVFFRLVERPSHRLSQRVGGRVQKNVDARKRQAVSAG